jgi:uncharacterized protein
LKENQPAMLTAGVISDTHGLLRPRVLEELAGVDLIIHAGDIGSREILQELHRLAPVFAVRGNMDRHLWARGLPSARVVEAGDVLIHVLHDLASLAVNPAAAGYRVVIFGHSHQPRVEEKGGVLYLNPGSAGPRRFQLPVTMARLRIAPDSLRPEIIHLPLD